MAATWRRNFRHMAFAFALCQATVTTPIGFATSLLDPAVGQIGTGSLMLCSMLSSLLLGAPVVTALGPKVGLLAAMSLSTAYAVLFAVATLQEPGSLAQWATYLTGAVLSGCGAGILWTAQGTFFADTSALIAATEETSLATVTSTLSGEFASILLTFEIAVKLSASLLQGSLLQWRISNPLMSLGSMFVLFAMLAGATVAAMTAVVEPTKPSGARAASGRGGVETLKAAFRLWPSPKIWCLSLTNLTFGFSAGYMNGFVNRTFASQSPSLGSGSLGTLLASTCLVASVAASFFGRLSQKYGKGVVVFLGATSFAAIPFSILLCPPSEENGFWGPWLISLYVLQGLGRAVYESTNKAVFADFFPGEQSTGAFANCMMQNAFAFFASFLLQNLLTNKSCLAWIVLALAALTAPGYAAARSLRGREAVGGAGEALMGGAR